MIKFFIIYTILFFSNIHQSLAQYVPYVSEVKNLIQNEDKKIDLESLGLDNASPKLNNDSKKTNESSKPMVDIITQTEEKSFSKNIINDSNTLKLAEENQLKNKNIKKNTRKISKKKSKKNRISNNQESNIANEINQENQNNEIKIIKKNSLRLNLEKQEKITINEKIQQEKLQKLEELRKLYLSDTINQEENQDDAFENEEKIIPKRKELAPFALEELPPLPILNRSRNTENFHIPYVYTPKEYIDIMFSAISMGSISYFNEAFKYVLNPNVTNDQGDTILTYAIFLKKYPVISSVLAKGADPNLPNKLGHNPVSIAIELLDFQALELLSKNKADLHYKDAFGRTYLMHASRLGFLPAVDLLIKNNVNINEMDNDGFTALSIAYRHKKELVVQYLLKNGAKTWVEKNYNPQYKYFINDLNNRWNQ